MEARFTDLANQTEQATSAPTVPVGSPERNHAPGFVVFDIKKVANDHTNHSFALPEKTPGYVLGSVKVFDRNKDDTHTYRLDDPRFEIKDGYLKLKDGHSVNFDEEKQIRLSFEVADQHGATFGGDILLNVQDDGVSKRVLDDLAPEAVTAGEQGSASAPIPANTQAESKGAEAPRTG